MLVCDGGPSGASSGVATAESDGTKGLVPVADQSGDHVMNLEVMGEETRYKLGDTLTLSFECSREGCLTIISIDPNDEVALMYPNQWAPDSSRFSKGTTLEHHMNLCAPGASMSERGLPLEPSLLKGDNP